MFSTVLTISGILFFGVSSASNLSCSNSGSSDYSYSLYQGIMDIFRESPGSAIPQGIGLINDNLDEFNLPIKRFHEDEKSVIIGLNEPMFVRSSFVEINCRQSEIRKILDKILPRLIASYTVVVMLKDVEDLYFDEIKTCMVDVFEKFIKEGKMNVAIMFLSNYKNQVKSLTTYLKVFSYVYEPFNEEPLRNVTGMSFREIFYDKTANLHLHPLKVMAFKGDTFFIEFEKGVSQPSGIDGSFTKILGQIYNATIIFTYRNEAEEDLRNSDLQQHLQQLRNGSFDMWMNAGLIYPQTYEGLVYSYPRERMDVICILPKYRDGFVKYKSIGGGRVLYLLVMMALLFPIVSFFVFLSNKLLLQKMPLLKLAKVVLNQSDHIMRKTSSTTMRLIFGTWLAVSLVYSTTLQTFITSRIIRPSSEDKMTTIQEVLESDIRLRIEQTHWKITKHHYDREMSMAMEKKIDIVADNDLFRVQASDIGYLTTKDLKRFMNKERSHVYVLHETFLPNLVAYYFPEKSPFIRRFNKALTIIAESGISQKWLKDNHYRLINGLKNVETTNPVKYITYEHLKSAMCVYGTGLFLAFVVFICEIKF